MRCTRDVSVQNGDVLAFDPKNQFSEKETKLKVSLSKEGLLSIAAKTEIKNVLVDTAVIDVPSLGTARAQAISRYNPNPYAVFQHN